MNILISDEGIRVIVRDTIYFLGCPIMGSVLTEYNFEQKGMVIIAVFFVFIDSTHGWEVRRITIILSAVNLREILKF